MGYRTATENDAERILQSRMDTLMQSITWRRNIISAKVWFSGSLAETFEQDLAEYY